MHSLTLPARTRTMPLALWAQAIYTPAQATASMPASPDAAHAALAEALRTIARQEERIRQLENLVQVDELTGLGNKNAMLSALRRELSLTRRDRKNAGFLILLQLNSAQELAQTHGRAVADCFLQQAAASLLGEVRSADTLCHLGDGLFAVIMPQIDVKNGAGRLARLEKALATRAAHIRALSLPFTVRLGFAFIEENETPESLLIAADARLYATLARKAG